eukprot:NODE_991_length_2774_cov_0.078849.p1 type:complete len:138 gc:universal NODE_991_length_2774_cov_0.078849:1909-1496(-)
MNNNLLNVSKRYSYRQATQMGISVLQGHEVMPNPPASIFYSSQMGGVNVAELKISNYSMRHKKWWIPVFLFYLNMILSNFQVIFKLLMGNSINGKDLRNALAIALIGNSTYRSNSGKLRDTPPTTVINNNGARNWCK